MIYILLISLSFIFMKVPLSSELHNLWMCTFHHNCDFLIALNLYRSLYLCWDSYKFNLIVIIILDLFGFKLTLTLLTIYVLC